MITQYKPNGEDAAIIDDITNTIRHSLDDWYGKGSSLEAEVPEIRSYRNSFILRYPVNSAVAGRKTILVKIRRNPKMDSLTQAVQSDIHQNIPTEYQSLQFVYGQLAHTEQDFGAIRPLTYMEKYYAIVMEEYPSQTLRQLLVDQRTSKSPETMDQLRDAARKTGRWLHYFHHHIHTPFEKQYTTDDILTEVQAYGERLESSSRGRVRSRLLLEAFARKMEHIHIDHVTFSQSHADMTCDNVLYSTDNRVCIIDIKTRQAPVYADLGLILIHPETSKPQIFSRGTYYPESLLREYRSEISAGYGDEKPVHEKLVRVYSAMKVLDKWLMYEELMNRYKGVKHLLAYPVAPFVTAYFQRLLKKHLELINSTTQGEALNVARQADGSA
jgi:thiamine kinase-like enzyme